MTKDEKQLTKMDTFYVADNIGQVIKELGIHSGDNPNIIGINEIAPISKIITSDETK